MTRDLYQEVTDKVIADLENGVAPWVKPWACFQPHGGQPYNAISGKVYRGINTLMLYAPQFGSSAWMTYKQAQDVSAQVRKGERGSMIVFYKPFVVEDRNAPIDGKEHTRTIPLLRCFHVFNTEQIDNLPAKFQAKIDERPEVERHAMAENLMAQSTVIHGGDRAYYGLLRDDAIHLPQPGAFRSMGDYYGTALHELTHWTGAKNRLDREYGKRFADTAYAREELVAELGAAFLCGYCGIAGKLQHSEYIGNWLQVLKSDKRAVLIAASAAQKAADFALGVKVASDEGEAIAA